MDSWTELGVGAIFLLLVLREVLNFLRSRNGNGLVRQPNPHPQSVKTGDLAASYWLTEFGDIKEALRRIEILMRERFPRPK